jgi:histone-lysine N-methyltransferase SETMAR
MNNQSEMLLDMLQLYAEHNFEGIITGDESWFLYITYRNSMFATSAREVVPRTKQNISAKKTRVTIFFISTRLLMLNFLPKGTKFNQDYFIDTVLPNLYSEKRRIARCKGVLCFSAHMDNSMCHNGARITEKLEKRNITRAPHPPDSPDLSPCDFWTFGILKQKMKERVLQSEEQILATITESWNELTFENIQRVFHNWMERLIWVIIHVPTVSWSRL